MSNEPISPELVLVTPEIREEALARQPPLPWEAVGDRSDASPGAETIERRATHAIWEMVAVLAQLAKLALVVVIVSVSLTLVLTLVADATR